jgi:hypothetical protein
LAADGLARDRLCMMVGIEVAFLSCSLVILTDDTVADNATGDIFAAEATDDVIAAGAIGNSGSTGVSLLILVILSLRAWEG